VNALPVFKLYIDGASRNNPGPAALGVVLLDGEGQLVEEYAEYLGETTNNVAEYTALIRGLERARQRGVRRLHVFSDSQLLVRQINGSYRVRSPHLKGLHLAALSLARTFEEFVLQHIPREMNRRADSLANQALDHQGEA